MNRIHRPPGQGTADPRPPRDAAGSAVAELGLLVRGLRIERGLTLDALAARAGVSRAMLSKVERGEKNPSITVVTRIAKGLDMPLTALLSGAAAPMPPPGAGPFLARAGARPAFRDPVTGMEREVLSPPLADGIEVLVHRLPPRRSSGLLPPYDRPTSKQVVVQEGTLTLQKGDERFVLGPADALWFELDAPYVFRNETDAPLSYVVVIVRHGPAG